jgi:hypothetical protein
MTTTVDILGHIGGRSCRIFFLGLIVGGDEGQACKIGGTSMSMADRTTYGEITVVSRWPVDPRQPINGLGGVGVVVLVARRERRCGERDENIGEKIMEASL